MTSLRPTVGVFNRLAQSLIAFVFLQPALAASRVDGVQILAERTDEIILEVIFKYEGERGPQALMTVMATHREGPVVTKRSPAVPIAQGQSRARFSLQMPGMPPGTWTTQIEVYMHASSQQPFLTTYYTYHKTWSPASGWLAPAKQTQPIGPGYQGAPVVSGRRILPDGKVEVRFTDGSTRIVPLDWNYGVLTPDGKRLVSIIDTQAPKPPDSPPDGTHTNWLQYENERLLGVIRWLVGNHEASMAAYLDKERPITSPYEMLSARRRAIENVSLMPGAR